MFQRTILRASRQQAARQTRPFAPLRQQVAITRATAIRWYSDAAPAKEGGGEAAETKEEAPAVKDDSAQLLEKKDKEIVDLKVLQNPPSPPPASRDILT